MPTASDTRLLPVAPGALWQLVCDPHHLPRWWPRVERVEGVEAAAFTEVLRSERGRLLRADFEVRERDDAQMRLLWAQRLQGTPFARVLATSETELRLTPVPAVQADRAATGGAEAGPAAPATEVTITLSQTLPGLLPRSEAWPRPGLLSGLFAQLGGPIVRRAAARTVREALDGLERIAV